jgi:hypothetical protein
MGTFSTLPIESILGILSFDLSFSDLLHMRLQNRRFRDIADVALKLLYTMEARAAAVVDDPTSKAPTIERIARLRRREKDFADNAGSEIDVATLRHINRPGGGIFLYEIIDLNSGFLLVGSPMKEQPEDSANTNGIFYICLPSFYHAESTPWLRVPFMPPPQEIIKTFRLAGEFNLLAIVTS